MVFLGSFPFVIGCVCGSFWTILPLLFDCVFWTFLDIFASIFCPLFMDSLSVCFFTFLFMHFISRTVRMHFGGTRSGILRGHSRYECMHSIGVRSHRWRSWWWRETAFFAVKQFAAVMVATARVFEPDHMHCAGHVLWFILCDFCGHGGWAGVCWLWSGYWMRCGGSCWSRRTRHAKAALFHLAHDAAPHDMGWWLLMDIWGNFLSDVIWVWHYLLTSISGYINNPLFNHGVVLSPWLSLMIMM